jgi:polyprenyl P-hydroxybenzoate/phenylacrylic acid decarboxylase-like protein
MSESKRLVVGVTGASCAHLAIRLLTELREQPGWETELVITDGGRKTIAYETDLEPEAVERLATRAHAPDDLGAALASGTYRTEGMVVVPCSMKTLAGVASGYSDNLLLRAADVTLKERRKLVLVPRETPLNPIHLRNMTALAALGVVLLPPMLTAYIRPRTIDDLELHIVGKVMHEFGLEARGFQRWQGAPVAERP